MSEFGWRAQLKHLLDEQGTGSSPSSFRNAMRGALILVKPSQISLLIAHDANTVERNVSKFPPILKVAGNRVSVRQDFNQGLNQAQLNNAAFQVVRAIADLKDHLRSAARRTNLDPEHVERTIDGSLPLQLMIDLANFDKHSQRDKVKAQRSERSPRLINVRGAIQISTGAGDLGPGGVTGIQLTPQGAKRFGTGKAAVIITGGDRRRIREPDFRTEFRSDHSSRSLGVAFPAPQNPS